MALPVGLPAARGSGDAAISGVASFLVDSVVESAACLLKKGPRSVGIAPDGATGLAKGVVHAMFISQLKIVLCSGLTLAAIAACVASGVLRHAVAQPQARRPGLVEIGGTSEATEGSRPEPRAGQPAEKKPASRIPADLAKLVPGRIDRSAVVTKDCMVLSYLPTWNHGNVDNLGLGNNDGGVRTLLDWPMATAQEASSPESKYFVALYSRKTVSTTPPGSILAFAVTDDWPEMTAWNDQPSYDPEPGATYKFEPGEGWKIFDITAIVKARARSGQRIRGVLFRFLSEDRRSQKNNSSAYFFVSREAAGEDEGRRPLFLAVSGPRH